jgi:transcriptional regulator with XRE-family HTH domain
MIVVIVVIVVVVGGGVKLRKEQGMTQEQLAEKCGTTKTYISRIENDASDIRLSTLARIVREGLGGHLKLSVEM